MADREKGEYTRSVHLPKPPELRQRPLGGAVVRSAAYVFESAEEYSDLLEAAGVDTVPELAQRNPVNLLNKLTEINNEKHLVRRLPTQREVSNWVDYAKVLPRRVVY